MTRSLAAFALLFAGTSPVSAQFYYGPGFGGGFTYRSSYGFSARGPGFHFSAYSRSFYSGPLVPYYYGWAPPTVGGWGPGYGNPFFLPPPGFDPAVVPVANVVPANPFPVPIRNANAVLPVGARPGEFLVITPKGTSTRSGSEGTISPMVDRVAPPPERPVPPAFRFDPLADRRVLGKTDVPERDPAAEAVRQVKQAREAFAIQEYGDAVEHLDRALRSKPDDAPALFLKGQAQFAAGQYAESVVNIQAGLKLAPNWPESDFKPKHLYGRLPVQFDVHVAELRKAVAANPNEVPLQFLLAYQLWFGGDRAEAKQIFRALEARLKDISAVEPFLK